MGAPMNDRTLRTTFAAIVAVIALVSCPLPTATVSGDGTAVPPEEPPAAVPTLELDPARGLVVYVSETGQRFDVVSAASRTLRKYAVSSPRSAPFSK